MSKRRNYRRKQINNDDEENEDDKTVSEFIEERKELQKFRERPKGVSAEALLAGKEVVVAESNPNDDPFKIKSGGGLTEMSSSSKSFGTSFSTETNQRDEDVQLLKYIEEGLKKKKGGSDIEKEENESFSKEDLLYQLPENINVKSGIMKSEEMLSSQMLTGIPEVDLGIEAKIKNIEATEEAKMKIIEDSKNRKEKVSFVPTNMATNYMHHSRFFDEKNALEKERKKEQAKKLELENTVVDKGPTVGKELVENADTRHVEQAMHGSSNVGGKKRQTTTDEYMYEKFKKRAKEGGWR